MKSLLTWLIACLLTVNTMAQSGNPDWAALSKRLIDETAGIKAGQYVLLQGGKHTLPLLEQLAADLHRRGANPILLIETDVTQRAFLYEKPETNLSDYPKHYIALLKNVDYFIVLPNSENYKQLNEGVDPKRNAIIGQVNEKIFEELSKSDFKYSSVTLEFPSKETAEISGIDFATYEKMHWAAMTTDYKKIEATGSKIMQMLTGARQVKITTAMGTNLTFSMGNRLAFKDDGILSDEERNSTNAFARYASLPGGWMDFAPDESTVNGTVVIAQGRCNYGPMTGISFTVKNGLMENFKAKQGQECFTREMQPHTGSKFMVSSFTIGLNPAFKVIQNEKKNYRPVKAAGYISLMIGNNNTLYNGNVVASGGYSFPITDATLEIDGRVVIRDGKIVD